MEEFRTGQVVRIPCSIEPGPFPNEHLVTIITDRGAVSGFVSPQFLDGTPGSNGFVRGTVARTSDSEVEVNIPGSFFTTRGLASVSRGWAHENLEGASA